VSDRHKAKSDGVYVLNGARFRAKKGALLPPGAEFQADATTEDEAATAADKTGPTDNEVKAAGAVETPETAPPPAKATEKK
jgi:hypothetical protein